MVEKKSIVFTLDAAVAFLLLVSVSAVVLLFSSVSTVPQTVQENLHLKASDSVNMLSSVQVLDVRRQPPIALLFDSGVVSEQAVLNESIMQLVADLWASGDQQNLSHAQNITDFFLSKLFAPGNNYAVYASNQSISNRTPSGYYSVATVSRNFVSGISSNRSLALGCVARAFVQKIRGKRETAIAYFGGFEGEGNITAIVRGMPAGANVSEVSIEANAGTNFTLYLNGANCGTLNKTSGLYDVNKWVFNSTQGNACKNAALTGADNVFQFNFTGENLSLKYFGGGVVKITYNTTDLAQTQSGAMRHYFNGVDGVINYYSSFYVPGNITQITGSLHLLNNYTTFLAVGNKTVYEDNGTNETRTIPIANSNFSAAFPNYKEISLKTVPLRLGVKANLTGQVGNADVILITDVSGSMDWRMDSDNSGTARNCNDPLLYDNSSKRISVAKCVDQNFVQNIFAGVGNRIALISFSAGISNYTDFTNDSVYLNNTINAYSAGGGTCIACAINKAYEIIAQQSPIGNNRTKHVIVMSDGVANYRGSGWCALDDSESKSNLEYIPGDYGGFIHYNPYNSSNWTDYASGVTNAIYSIAPINASFAIATGASGKFFSWNGTAWVQVQDAGSMVFYGISLLNSTFGFAVGDSGKIYQLNGGTTWNQNSDQGSQTYRGVSVWDAVNNVLVAGYDGTTGQLLKWNGGTSWTATTVSNILFYDVKHLNSSWAFAVGSSGKIYRWNGANWAEYQDTGSQTWRALAVINSSSVYIAGSGGAIYRWSGTTFSSFASPTSTQINGINFYNDSLGKIVTSSSLVYHYSSGAWILARDARYTGTLSSAAYCSDPDSCATQFANNYAAQNANWSSCRLRQYLNSTNYAVGFGPVTSCSLANTTLNEIAKCGNGTYFASSNASELAQFYTSLAKAIVQQSNASQVVTITGGVQTVLYPDSYLDFTFTPQFTNPYQSISIQRSAPLSSCKGSFNTPVNFSIYDFRATSYSADRWTSNVTTNNSLGYSNAFNLSVYNSTSYSQTGDPFPVQLNPSLIAQGGQNTIDVRTAFSPSNETSVCSTNNSILYSGWLNASVGYGNFFPYCFARNVTVYFDLDGDNVADGVVNVQVGGEANETAINASQLNQNGNNAIEDAFLRLLRQLDLNTAGGAPGSQQNPIDVALSEEVISTLIANSGLPALNSTDFSVVVWR